MKLLLKTLLIRRARDEGFVLPVVIAIGLIMILLGVANIVRSNEENLTAISQNSSADAFAIAEIGIARYRELLNNNRILTVYNLNQWNTADVLAETCNDITTTPNGWADGGTAAAVYNINKWWEITEDFNTDGTVDASIGQYRIIQYEYDIDGNVGDADGDGVLDDTNDNGVFDVSDDADNDTDGDNESDARGLLTVQGRSLDGSEAQIEVEIPLRVNDLENLAPALWIGNGALASNNFGNAGELEVDPDDNVVLSDSGGGCPFIAGIDGENAIYDPRDLPPIINEGAISASNKNTLASLSITTDTLLPTSSADNQNDDRFFYVADNDLNITDADFAADGTSKVTVYVKGNLDITNSTAGNSVNIGNYSTTSNLISSNNLEIFIDDSSTRNINIATGGGTVNIEAFIHAPSATVNITGGGTVNINGAMWINTFNNSGGTVVNIQTDETSTTDGFQSSYNLYSTSDEISPRPLTGSPTNWQREEVE
ncbi:hypothetical protein [Myxosarcina sp. GI1]|uniref:DUF7305 domain-containing protein n=1 Tax=Myxosarcina sp. GI1 TaxID=1541065 RepID=UPI00055CEB0E|nr:hypothetical protein [Myxosarcina sp. GI1]